MIGYKIEDLDVISSTSNKDLRIYGKFATVIERVMSEVYPAGVCYSDQSDLLFLVEDAISGVHYQVNLREFLSDMVAKEYADTIDEPCPVCALEAHKAMSATLKKSSKHN